MAHKKIQRHIYFDPEMDEVILTRKTESRRTYAEEVRILIERGLEAEGDTPPGTPAAKPRRARKTAAGAMILAGAMALASPAPARAMEMARAREAEDNPYSVYLDLVVLMILLNTPVSNIRQFCAKRPNTLDKQSGHSTVRMVA